MIDGEPASALRAKARAQQGRDGMWHARMYSPSANVAWMDAARVAYDRQHPEEPHPRFGLGTPVGLSVVFVFSRPAGHWGTGRNAGVLKGTAPKWHTSRPDTDNLIKLALDALAGRVVANDQQVACFESVEKRYADPGELAHTELRFWELGRSPGPVAQEALALVA